MHRAILLNPSNRSLSVIVITSSPLHATGIFLSLCSFASVYLTITLSNMLYNKNCVMG